MSSLILAIDTATPAVTAGVVRRDGDAIDVLAERVTLDARAHAEQLTPNAVGALADAGVDVGISRRSSSAADRGRSPVFESAWPPPRRTAMRSACRCTACAASTPSASWPGETCWWSPTRAGARCTGRATATVCASRVRPSTRPGRRARRRTRRWQQPPRYPTAAGLVRAVADWTSPPAPLVPLYLRRPDAKTLAERAAR